MKLYYTPYLYCSKCKTKALKGKKYFLNYKNYTLISHIKINYMFKYIKKIIIFNLKNNLNF